MYRNERWTAFLYSCSLWKVPPNVDRLIICCIDWCEEQTKKNYTKNYLYLHASIQRQIKRTKLLPLSKKENIRVSDIFQVTNSFEDKLKIDKRDKRVQAQAAKTKSFGHRGLTRTNFYSSNYKLTKLGNGSADIHICPWHRQSRGVNFHEWLLKNDYADEAARWESTPARVELEAWPFHDLNSRG